MSYPIVHHAGHGWYEVDSSWVTSFFLALRVTQQARNILMNLEG